MKMKFNTPFDFPVHSGLTCPEKSLTQQQFADDADINIILERFRVTGVVPPGTRIPEFVDFSNAPTSFVEAMRMVEASRDSFMMLPADIRARLNHDPSQLESFLNNPDNRVELIKRGFIEPVERASAVNAPSANAASSTSA